MTLKTFNATHVTPGQPLTAQAWNDIVDAIDQAYQYLQATMHSVHVQITNPELASQAMLETVRVFAVLAGSPPFEAVRPVVPGGPHVLAGLPPGAYTLQAEAVGYTPATTTINVTGTGASDTAVSMALAPAGVFMPALFGLPLAQAKQQLATLQIKFDRLLDFNGSDMAPASTDFDNTPVLLQSPPLGTFMNAGDSAQLVVGVPQKVESGVMVPSLAGLSQAEAQKALESIGLVLGKVQILRRPAPVPSPPAPPTPGPANS
jgi:hypothetical protein